MVRRPAKPAAGIALVSVLGLITLLSVLAFGVLESARRHGQLAKRSFQAFQAQELADSAIRVGILELSAPTTATDIFDGAGFTRTVKVFGRAIAVSAELENTRVDLNYADGDLLLSLFAAYGVEETKASEIAGQIMDWRDADDERTAQGAERPEYMHAGRAVGPRNGPFETISEVRLVLSGGSLSDQLLEALTVYSHAAGAGVGVEGSPLARAHRWADARQLGGHRWLDTQSPGAVVDRTESLASKAVRFRACVDATDWSVCRRAIVRFTGNTQQPWQILAWQTLHGSDASSQSKQGL